MDHSLELRHGIDQIIRNAQCDDLGLLRSKIDLFLEAANSLTEVWAARYKAQRSLSPKFPPKLQKAPTKLRNSLSVPETQLDSSKRQKSTQRPPQAVSRIQQGILQASAQQALRQEVYGPQNPEVAFAKAAKALAG